MAAKLQCEICGGKLIGKPGGVFECDSCGMEYDTAWAKAKIQEITGTVKVEGTVEVQGTVKIEGTANKESQLKRGYLALEDGAWDDAKSFFNEALNADAECAEAYLGLAMAEANIMNRNTFAAVYMQLSSRLNEAKNITRARQFGNETLCAWFNELDAKKAERVREESAQREKVRQRFAPAQKLLSTSINHTVGLRLDGTAIATGTNEKGQCNVSAWRDLVAVAANNSHTVGLCADGTAVATGLNDKGQCNVSSWTNLVAIDAGESHTVGLHADGTAVAVGSNTYGQCVVSDWKNLIAIAAGSGHTVGLRTDGTAVIAGHVLRDHRNEVSGWTGLVDISAGDYHTVGLRSDGTVVAAGSNSSGECDVSGWKDIVAISTGSFHTVGIRSNGTAVVTRYTGIKNPIFVVQNDVSGWSNIVAVAAAGFHTVGLRADGTVVAEGFHSSQTGISGWKLFNSVDTIEKERPEAKKRTEAFREAVRRRLIATLKKEQTSLNEELTNLKGFFSGKRRKEIEARLSEIDAELKKLQ